MELQDVGAVLVVANERLVGIATDRDLAVRGLAKRLDPETPISEIMSENVTTVQRVRGRDRGAPRSSVPPASAAFRCSKVRFSPGSSRWTISS